MKIYLIVFSALLLAPFYSVFATGDVTLNANAAIIQVSGYSLTVSGIDSVLDSITVDSGSFSLTMSANQSITIVSPDRVTLSVPSTGSIQSASSCTVSQSSYSITNPASGTVATFTVSLSSTACDAGGGSSSSNSNSVVGGNGGIGISNVAPIIPVQTSVPNPVPNTSATTGTTQQSSRGISGIFIKNLAAGSRGDDVKRLQQLLALDKTIYPEGLTTGYFGSLTKKAITQFQLKYGVIKKSNEPGSGNFGPKTRAKIKEVFGK